MTQYPTSILKDLAILPIDTIHLILQYSIPVIRCHGNDLYSVDNQRYSISGACIVSSNPMRIIYDTLLMNPDVSCGLSDDIWKIKIPKRVKMPKTCRGYKSAGIKSRKTIFSHINIALIYKNAYFLLTTHLSHNSVLYIVGCYISRVAILEIPPGYKLFSLNNKILILNYQCVDCISLDSNLFITNRCTCQIPPNVSFQMTYNGWLLAVSQYDLLFYDHNIQLIKTISLRKELGGYQLYTTSIVVEAKNNDILICLYSCFTIRIKAITNILDNHVILSAGIIDSAIIRRCMSSTYDLFEL